MRANSIYDRLYRRPFDWFWRLWFSSSVQNRNGQQCPRCRGTDKAVYLGEGFACGDLLRCQRCNVEFWT